MVRLGLSAAIFAALARWSPDTAADSNSGIDGPDPTLLAAAALFVVAALTDAADGYLARKWNAITRFGRVMDPFADKVLVLGALVLLAGPAFSVEGRSIAGFTGWMVVLILARELLVTSLRGLAEAGGTDASANWAGKAKMILQSVAVPGVILLLGTLPIDRATPINAGLAWATTIVTVFSAWPYIANAIRPTPSADPQPAHRAGDEPTET